MDPIKCIVVSPWDVKVGCAACSYSTWILVRCRSICRRVWLISCVHKSLIVAMTDLPPITHVYCSPMVTLCQVNTGFLHHRLYHLHFVHLVVVWPYGCNRVQHIDKVNDQEQQWQNWCRLDRPWQECWAWTLQEVKESIKEELTTN